MNDEREKRLTVGELARKGGVTVRTLQYYDKSGLLTPSEYSEGGRRMYGRADIIRLQQILFLKSMGFSLEEIRDKILPAESSAELKEIIVQQKEMLAEQAAGIRQTIERMDEVLKEIDLGSEIGIDRLLFIIRAAGNGNPYSFMIRHFSKDQLEYLFTRFEGDDALAFSRTMREFTSKLTELYRRNEQPDGIEGQKLAERWWEIMLSVTKGDMSLIPKMARVVMDEADWPSDAKDLMEANQSFLRQAIQTYLKKNNIKLM